MKNMMLPAKSCSILLCALLLLAAGCKKEDPETFVSDIVRPIWTVPSDYDVTSSMTAVVKVDLKAQYPDKAADFVLDDNDLLAAFSGETCLGTASPQDGLFFLYVAGVNEKMGNEQMVNLKYYSAHYKNLFQAKDTIPFRNETNLGTVAEPFIPHFVITNRF